MSLRVLLIDNYDSYTYNLLQRLAEITGSRPDVLRNDEIGKPDQLARHFDAIVISPGPGHPGSDRDFGRCAAVIRECELPILGVCLGHQGIAHAFGGAVRRAPAIFHGRTSSIRHEGDPLFGGIATRFPAVRYHSQAVCDPLPPAVQAIAWDEEGVVMALRHRRRPIWGVQFHPESIGTPDGTMILANFLSAARRFRPVGIADGEAGPEIAGPAVAL
jgi:para-aminobenzoate synthetase